MLLIVVILGLCYCSKESNQSPLGRPRLSGPSEALVKQIVTFVCELETYPKNEPILLQLIQKGNHTKPLGESTSLSGGNGSFLIEIKRKHEGNLQCRANLQNNTSMEPTFSDVHYLKVFEPVKGGSIVIESGASEFFERTTLNLVCSVTEGTDVSYKWLMNGQLIASSHFHLPSDEHLWTVNSTTSKDSGSYMCIATNHFNGTTYTSNSSQVIITVKDLVSDPEISFKVLKETSDNYTALVTCNSTRGAAPVTFSLYSNEQLVASMMREANLEAKFKVPLVLGQHMGFLQCRANNTDRITQSLQMALKVVPVSGRVTIHYETETGEDYAVVGLRLYCKVETGTHPRYQWFLNDTLLDGRGNFYYVVHQSTEQSMLWLSVDRSAGTYHCEVSDIVNTTAISSTKHYLDKEVLNHLPGLLVGFVFGCFTLVILLVSACCCAGVLLRNKQYGVTSATGLEMVRVADAYEDELDLSGYSEDADEMKTPREVEFDQASEASLEEWPGIVKQKKTSGEEPAE